MSIASKLEELKDNFKRKDFKIILTNTKLSSRNITGYNNHNYLICCDDSKEFEYYFDFIFLVFKRYKIYKFKLDFSIDNEIWVVSLKRLNKKFIDDFLETLNWDRVNETDFTVNNIDYIGIYRKNKNMKYFNLEKIKKDFKDFKYKKILKEIKEQKGYINVAKKQIEISNYNIKCLLNELPEDQRLLYELGEFDED